MGHVERTIFDLSKDWKELKDYIEETRNYLERETEKAKEKGDGFERMRLIDRYACYNHMLDMMNAFDRKYI